MSIGKIEFELQVGEHEGPVGATYNQLGISAHDDDGHVLMEVWEETEADVEDDVKVDIKYITFPLKSLDRVIAYLQLINQWSKDVDNFPVDDAPHAVDNGDGTGSLKGKLVGMGF
jgi:hypothetical protein